MEIIKNYDAGKLDIAFAVNREKSFFPEIWNDIVLRRAAELGFNIRIPTENFPEDAWPEFLSSADAIITTWSSPRIDARILRVNKKLRVVGHAAGSVAEYVSPEMFERGIALTSANNDMAHAVAEWCLMAALMGIRRTPRYTRFGGIGKLNWPERNDCGTIRNATIGIWGYGAVAGYLHEMLKPLQPGRFLVSSNHLSVAEAGRLGVTNVPIQELFASADLIFLLAGLNDHTNGMIGAPLLQSIKNNAVLINAGRGQLVRENEMIEELRRNRFTAVLDVFEQEPLPDYSPLLNLPNVIMTPHNAGYPSRNGYVVTILEEFDRFFNREPLRFPVNQEKIKFMTVTM